jgi:glucan phosphorylase
MSLSITLQICAVLYPGDATEEGKLLRLKQQFFLCSASLQVVKQFISLEQGSNKRNQACMPTLCFSICLAMIYEIIANTML